MGILEFENLKPEIIGIVYQMWQSVSVCEYWKLIGPPSKNETVIILFPIFKFDISSKVILSV
jgi:hypothetical protein